jgi:hypothetical protein
MTEIGVPNAIALVYVREMAGAEAELQKLHVSRETILHNEMLAHLLATIIAGSRREGHPDHGITEQYLVDPKMQSQLMRRFDIMHLNEVTAEVARLRLGDLGRLDQRFRHQERRRDQGLRSLVYANKVYAQRLQNLLRKREQDQHNNPTTETPKLEQA